MKAAVFIGTSFQWLSRKRASILVILRVNNALSIFSVLQG